MGLESTLLSQLGATAPAGGAREELDWSTVARASQMLCRMRRTEDVLDSALDCLTTPCGASAGAVWLYDAAGEHLFLAAERGLRTADGSSRPGWTDSVKLPLNSGGLLIGVLEAYTRDERCFSEAHRSAFQLLGAALAGALHRCRLAEDAARDSRAEADGERRDEVGILTRLWRFASHAPDYPSWFGALLQGLGDDVPFDAAMLVVLNGSTPQFLAALRHEAGRAQLADLEQRALSAVTAFGVPAARLQGAETHLVEPAGEGSEAALASGFGVPLMQNGALAGLLYVAALQPQAFAELHVRVLYAFAASAADSMARVRGLFAGEMERLETIIESLPQGVILLDSGGEVLLANRHGRERLAMLSGDMDRVTRLGDRDLAGLVREALGSGIDLVHTEFELRRDERTVDFDVTVVPVREGAELVGVVLSIHDISRIRQTEQRLYHDARLASIGEFASGLAHELNNPMMILLGLAEVLQDDDGLPPERRALLGEVQTAALRAADIVKQLMVFADTQCAAGWDTLDLREVLEQAVALVATQYEREGVAVELSWADDLLPVQGNPGKLQQVVLSLLANAREAILQSGVGSRIRVATRRHGEQARVEVADDGPGVPPELRSQIFDVFFTTKRDYQGKGLGLSIAHRIAAEHNGRLTLEASEVGALFRLALPVSGLLSQSCGRP
ncbi:MAG: PAS domain S-box protein [Armatimonadetes bacterium]|nr:PAS domain S-box protein [Armatimonadota bacterium]